MKQLLLVTTMLLSICFAKAQDIVDDFNVGPYEVYYKGQGDVNFRLRKGVDLYEYFGLKKDTVIQVLNEKIVPLKCGTELRFFGETALYRCARYSMVYVLEGVWKQRFAKKTYFNGGLSFGYASTTVSGLKENVMEFGIPLSVELANLNAKKATLYGSLGISPTYYTTMTVKNINLHEGEKAPEKYSGLYIAPRIELGGYIPVGKQIIKIGVNWRYKINCSSKDYDLYNQIVGQSFIGTNIGIVF